MKRRTSLRGTEKRPDVFETFTGPACARRLKKMYNDVVVPSLTGLMLPNVTQCGGP